MLGSQSLMGGKFEHVEDRRPLVGDSEKDSESPGKSAVRLGKNMYNSKRFFSSSDLGLESGSDTLV